MTIDICTRPQVQHTWLGRRFQHMPRQPKVSPCGQTTMRGNKTPTRPTTPTDPALRARVLWVGNVPQFMRDIDLKMLFTAAMQEHDRVTHVRIKRQPTKQWNSATIFLNRCVTIQDLICRMRAVHKGHNLLIRKCRGKDRKNRHENKSDTRSNPGSDTSSSRSSSPSFSSRGEGASPHDHRAARQAVMSFFAHFSQPPPARPGSPVYNHFVEELEDDRNMFDLLLGPSIPQ